MLKRAKNIETRRPASPKMPRFWPGIPVVAEPRKIENETPTKAAL